VVLIASRSPKERAMSHNNEHPEQGTSGNPTPRVTERVTPMETPRVTPAGGASAPKTSEPKGFDAEKD
jgi:hypothetical protein